MILSVNFLNVRRKDSRINLRACNAAVAQKFLDIADIGPVFKHSDRARVPQTMGFQPLTVSPARHDTNQFVIPQPMSPHTQEKFRLARRFGMIFPGIFDVILERHRRIPAERNHPVFIAFTVTNE